MPLAKTIALTGSIERGDHGPIRRFMTLALKAEHFSKGSGADIGQLPGNSPPESGYSTIYPYPNARPALELIRKDEFPYQYVNCCQSVGAPFRTAAINGSSARTDSHAHGDAPGLTFSNRFHKLPGRS